MGKVVDIESKPRRRKARGRKKPSKTALVLGGGGFTGGVYEIGALRALDLLAVNSTVNNFDVYVGTSAGSFVAAMLANGVTPDEMMQVLNPRVPSELEDLDLNRVLKPNYLGFLSKAVGAAAAQRWSWCARWPGWARSRRSTSASAWPRRCRPASTRMRASADYVAEVLADSGRVNDFRLLERELYLTATDLDTCERIVFGEEGWHDVPISKAVQCSTALPIVYKPVDLKGRQMVDGGIRSTTNVDIAVEKGAKFIVVVNPLVPTSTTSRRRFRPCSASRVRRVSDMGLPAIANQTFRLIAHRACTRRSSSGRSRYPGVDIILVEPEPNDELMFGTPIMDYSRRLRDRPPRLRIGHRDPGQGLRALSRRSPSATASRSPSAASAACVEQAPPRRSPSRPPPGAGSSSRRPRCCCGRAASRTSEGSWRRRLAVDG